MVSVRTYSHNLVRQRLCLLFSLGKISARSVQFSCVQFLVKHGLNAKQLLVNCELVPSTMSRGTGTERDVVSMSMRWTAGCGPGWRRVRLPGLKFTLTARSFLTNVGISLKRYKSNGAKE